MEINELYSEVIKDHNLSNHNKHRLDSPDISLPGKNPSCGDELELSLNLKDGGIEDGAYTGIGCAISQASVSIMIDLVRGKTLEEAGALCRMFLMMIRGEKLTEEEESRLEEAAALSGVAKMPARVKCAAMPWHTLERALRAIKN